jgi:hypothetical protein
MNATAPQTAISQNKLINPLDKRCNMSTKDIFRWIIISSLAVIILLLWVEITPVHADCGEPPPSSCTICHAQEDPVSKLGEWHIIHASKDICINCHGGNGRTMNKALAHETLTANPLSDIYTDCHSCHPQDYIGRADLFAPTLGVTPGSCTTPTPVTVSKPSGGPQSGGINLSSNPISTTSSPSAFLIIGGMLSIMVFFMFGLVLIERHHI